MKVRAAVTFDNKDTFHFTELFLREPLEDEVLVKIQATGLCNCDLHYMHDNSQPYPIVMGHEGAGIIEKLGSKVTNFRVGDRVIIATNHCGKCQKCKEGLFYDCEKVMDYWVGNQVDRKSPLTLKSENGEEKEVTTFSCHATFADHAVVKACTLVKVEHDDVELKHVCFLGCCPITGAGSVFNYFKAKAGQSIVISRMGTVGLCCVMAAKIAGLSKIVAIDRHNEKLELARKFGATATINPVDDENLDGMTGDFDFAAESTGNKELSQKIDKHLQESTMRYDINGSVDWPFACIGNSIKDQFIPQMIEYFRQGKFPIDQFLTYYKFDDIEKAYNDLKNKKVIRPILLLD
ncbi:Aryl-alcohol dehydrogenase [Tritrichomonas foetus]|uniref:Aryl-alcohol dehydrogenase n=1 Tax=Tritrichomonas foetus TaxID=1144522 RepID=A0A1J4KI52_9EUKA|nr:Aryl-alcohol dehydrogenase [Tritrichomonas foetus]|eukprot:OHT11049.1 Aryl-alcohol dehydrogenase [Tritrichomonas foetus]